MRRPDTPDTPNLTRSLRVSIDTLFCRACNSVQQSGQKYVAHMPDHPHDTLQAIHAMLAAGHRSVQIEKHSLFLWGGIGGLLCVTTDHVLTAERFPDITQRAVALLLWLTAWIGAVGGLDHWLTRRARLARKETLPFARAQITRAWWMLFAMFFYGGGAMVYALWIVLLGLGIYLLTRPIEVALQSGEPDGRYRLQGGSWAHVRVHRTWRPRSLSEG